MLLHKPREMIDTSGTFSSSTAMISAQAFSWSSSPSRPVVSAADSLEPLAYVQQSTVEKGCLTRDIHHCASIFPETQLLEAPR